MSTPPPSNRHDQTIPNPTNSAKPISISSYSAAEELTTSLDPTAPLIFAHGASGSMHTPSVLSFAIGASHHRDVVTFQGNMNLKARVNAFVAVARWAAMQHMATTGKTRETYHTITNSSGAVLGGRSMGARAAVMAVGELEARDLIANGEGDAEGEETKVKLNKRLVLVSYPLIAGNGKGESKLEEREKLLLDLPASFEVLFVVGTRDSMCPLEKLQEVRARMQAKSWLVRVEGANHGMEVKPKGMMQAVVEETGRLAALWLEARNTERREGRIWLEEKAGEGESKGKGKEKEMKFSHWQAELPVHENGDREEVADENDGAEEAEGDEHGDEVEEPEASEEHHKTPIKGRKDAKSPVKAKATAQSKRDLPEEKEEGDGKQTPPKKKSRRVNTDSKAGSDAATSANGSIASRTRSGRKT